MTPGAWAAVTSIVEAAYPAEGCGWIAGDEVREVGGGTRDAFRFDDRDVLTMMKANADIVFHSHPDGDERLSAADLAGLALHPVNQLVVAVAGGRARVAAPTARCDGPLLCL